MVIYNTFIECDKSEEISWYAVEDPEGTQTQEEIDFKRKAGQNAQSIRCNNQRLSLENEIPVGE
jgi:carbonic anhydrase